MFGRHYILFICFVVDELCCWQFLFLWGCVLSFHAVTLIISSCSPHINFMFILATFVLLLLFSLVAILLVFFETFIIITRASFLYRGYNTDNRVRLCCNFHLPFRELSCLFSASEVLVDMTAMCALQPWLTAIIYSFCSIPQSLPIEGVSILCTLL